MNDLCLWSLVIAICCLGAPVLAILVASARIAGDEAERERERRP